MIVSLAAVFFVAAIVFFLKACSKRHADGHDIPLGLALLTVALLLIQIHVNPHFGS